MGQRNLDDVAVRELFNFIRTSAEVDAYRIRVPELARKKGVDENRLQTLVYMPLGLVYCTCQDLICPHCRGARKQYKFLKDVETEAACEACSIEFGSDHENALEIAFHIDKEIRDVTQVFYCAAEPSTKSILNFNKY